MISSTYMSRDGLTSENSVEPCIAVIFGVTGDLTKRKLIPAFYNLLLSRSLPSSFSVIGVARTQNTSEIFRKEMRSAVSQFSRSKPVDEVIWSEFEKGIHYLPGSFTDSKIYSDIRERIALIETERGALHNRLFYLAVPPAIVKEIAKGLFDAGLVHPNGNGTERSSSQKSRVIAEKPFGSDLHSARILNETFANTVGEQNIFRIDHYLGKETVQNLLVFRFANSLFEPLWNREHIDHVQITVAEDIGVEGRGKFYEQTGALRDIVQNHALQLLCLTAMEPPISFSADAVRDEKVKALRSLRHMHTPDVHELVVRGQYGHGLIRTEEVVAYRNEPNVDPKSNVETFVAMKILIDNWRWSGVPFYVRAGKRLARRATEIAIQFKRVPHGLFRPIDGGISPNVLTIRIQPDEQISLRFTTKEPGQRTVLRDMSMDFHYGSAFGSNTPEAYERLLLDAMRGDATLFTRADEVEEQWKFASRILQAWQEAGAISPPIYGANTWGPDPSDDLLAKDGRRWRKP